MATLDSALSLTLFASHRFSNNHRYSPKPHDSIKFHPSLHNNLFFSSKSLSFSTSTSLCFQLCSALQEAPPPTSEEKTEQNQTKTTNLKTKLFVFNLPWTLSAVDIKELFAQCGNVTDVEIIKSKDGRSKGFCFVTMATGEEAMDAVNKFDSYEISGRILRVEFSKRFKKPSPARPPGPPLGETRHVIFATNVAWKARSTHFRDFITENFKQPVSARVVFDSPTGRSAGYAFASFLTKEDAEAAISALDGKELMGRPLHLKFSERKVKEAGSKQDDNNTQLEDSADDAQLEEDTDDAQPEDNTDDTQLEDDNDDAQPEDDQLIES
ncbi:putative RNA recognition motif domain-containing protein [Lupinus albus]|uniref:Putative RNA recognition motif domain-containing protein n=1 Tax=Lupinus albus TaxID=3870 RepID=A0A6A4QG04_LUPAL|nr:putative RNA recognition motif domain-containing protein [Lupinus albus]